MDDLAVITQAARLLADPLRLRVLVTLGESSLTVNELATQLHASQPRISAHLAILREAGWVDAATQGRQHYYRLASPHIHVVLQELAATPMANAPVEDTDAPVDSSEVELDMRMARSCYDHLGGVAGVQMYDWMIEQEWLQPTTEGIGRYKPAFILTPTGERALTERGVIIPSQHHGRRRFAYACPDWTENRPHLGGALAVALFQRLQADGIVQRQKGSRAVLVADTFLDWFMKDAILCATSPIQQ